MTTTSFWAGSSQVTKRGLHIFPHKPSSSQCIGVTVDLPARRNSGRLCRRRKWRAWRSGTDGAFSQSTSWPEVSRWMPSVTAKHCRNCNGPFRTSGAGCLVPVLSCCTIMLSHTQLDNQHISCRSSDLAPSDSHHFLHLKKFLSGQHFENDREAEMNVTQWLQSRVADFYNTGLQKSVPQYDKCLNSEGENVEK